MEFEEFIKSKSTNLRLLRETQIKSIAERNNSNMSTSKNPSHLGISAISV
jgi:hypothetical protein